MATKDQQRAELVEGLAFGLALLGVGSIPKSKIDFELAVSHALRRWDSARAYPSIIGAHKPDNEVWIGLTKSAGRRTAFFRFDKPDAIGDYVIATPSWWTPDDNETTVGGRSAEEWRALAMLFAEWDGWKR